MEGVIAYPVTPFRPSDGRVDLALLGVLIDRLVEAGCHGVAPLGSTGESAYLEDDEWRAVAEASVGAVAGRVPAIVGVSELTTDGAIRRARFAESVGADAVMVLAFSYWRLSESEVVRHFGRIAESIGIPMMIYNNPGTSGVDLSPELMAGLAARVENITMVKESSGDIGRMARLAELAEGRLRFFNGSNALALEAFAAGAAGWCTAAPGLIPGPVLGLYQAVRCGDLAAAEELFARQLPLLRFLREHRLPRAVKAGLVLQGLNVGEPRSPLSPLDPEDVQHLKRLLAFLDA